MPDAAPQRRRGEALLAAIRAATLDELSEHGYAALTMEAVARRAGASKASLYRRWPSRADLVIDCVRHIAPAPADLPDTGELRGDLVSALTLVARALDGVAGEAMRGLLAEALPDVDRLRQLRATTSGRHAALMREVVARAVSRGEAPAEALAPLRLEVGVALLRHRFLFDGGPLSPELVGEIVDEVLLPLFLSREG